MPITLASPVKDCLVSIGDANAARVATLKAQLVALDFAGAQNTLQAITDSIETAQGLVAAMKAFKDGELP